MWNGNIQVFLDLFLILIIIYLSNQIVLSGELIALETCFLNIFLQYLFFLRYFFFLRDLRQMIWDTYNFPELLIDWNNPLNWIVEDNSTLDMLAYSILPYLFEISSFVQLIRIFYLGYLVLFNIDVHIGKHYHLNYYIYANIQITLFLK